MCTITSPTSSTGSGWTNLLLPGYAANLAARRKETDPFYGTSGQSVVLASFCSSSFQSLPARLSLIYCIMIKSVTFSLLSPRSGGRRKIGCANHPYTPHPSERYMTESLLF